MKKIVLTWLIPLVIIGLSGLVFWGIAAADNSDSADFPLESDSQAVSIQKHAKMSSALARLVSGATLQSTGQMDALRARPSAVGVGEDQVRVIVEASGDNSASLISAVRALGANVEAHYARLLQVETPIELLPEIALLPGVKYVRLPAVPVPQVTSEGLDSIGVSFWHDALLSGSGVRVAVMDGGFAGYESLLGSELPSSVTIYSPPGVSDISGWGVHGVACAEIIHDIAPDADIWFAFFRTEVEWLNAVDWLIDQDVDIISHSVSWIFAGPGDGTGWACDKISEVRDAGILWVQSAGNYGQTHWQGLFFDPDNDSIHNFNTHDETNKVWVQAGKKVSAALRWNDPWENSANDYDLYLLNGSGGVVASSTDLQDGDDHPEEMLETFVYTSDWYSLQIRKASANGLARFDLFTIDKELEHQVTWGSVMDPGDGAGALTVGAVPWDAPETLREFSGRGPTDDDRTKPDLVAPDGISTASFDGLFEGTSASAVLVQQYPDHLPAQLQVLLEAKAVSCVPEKNNLYGSGQLSLGALPQTIVVGTELPDDPVNHTWNTINEGIDDASTGDTVLVHEGYYPEKVVIDKPIILQGEGMPVVDAKKSKSAVSIIADGCTVSGFDLCKGGWDIRDAALQVLSDHNRIEKTIVRDSWIGFCLWSSYGNLIGGLIVRDNQYGASVIDGQSSRLCCNSFISNGFNAWDNPGGNHWDNSDAGNYWDDYEGKYPGAHEVDESGIWDTPYAINGGMTQDGYPLLETPFQVEVSQPTEGAVLPFGAEFTLGVEIKNATPLILKDVSIFLSLGDNARIVASGSPVKWIETIAGNDTVSVTWPLKAGTQSGTSLILAAAGADIPGVGALFAQDSCEILVDWDPWMYDANTDGIIQYTEMVTALLDYLTETIGFDQMVTVLMLYLQS